MKNVIPILLFFVTSLSYSQDLLVSFSDINQRKKNDEYSTVVFIDDGVNKIRRTKIPNTRTPLAVIKYFQNEGFKVDARVVGFEDFGLGAKAHQFYLFCYRIGKGKE